ncbi:hypothetical protein QQG74_03360 [Micromonospora sp. FIMYZ51]|uniref:hypothetical protein n=1 Tax=Micromonospora sp. FIMYZ51 TaxID=3051832 RepID=UPI00311E07EE
MQLVDAATVERLTYEALERRGLAPAEGVTEPAWGALFAHTLASVGIGATPEDLQFVWRV